MTDRFSSFVELKAYAPGPGNWVVHTSQCGSPVLVMAIHGGTIEPGTTQLAAELSALGEYDFYTFECTRQQNAEELHITSSRFDESIALQMVRDKRTVISLHGCKGTSSVIYIGGGVDEKRREAAKIMFEAAGFVVAEHDDPGLQGTSPFNICNRGKNPGLQLELTRKLRDDLMEYPIYRAAFLNALKAWVEYTHWYHNHAVV